jgi:stearoyl-CoA desaturase (Delta-9 desaturase)
MYSFLYGFVPLSFWGYIVLGLVLTHITIVGVTVYLHRHSAHRALDLHPIVTHFFRFWLWLTTGMVTKHWTAIHRKHHAKCETQEDPHSPQILGIAAVLWQGAELYRREAQNEETMKRYGFGTPDDALEYFYTRYTALGLRMLLVLQFILFGIPGVMIWALQMAWIPFFAAGVVNGIGHYWGYRNFECPDAARNILPWGILIGGEELHNNHHTYPSSAKLSVKPWEFDIGWLYISILSFFGLAKVKRSIPQTEIGEEALPLDGERLGALLYNRLEVMARYSSSVLEPVFKEAIAMAHSKEARTLLKKVRKTLLMHPALVEEEDKTQLDVVLATTPALDHVMAFRMQLQAIWDHRVGTQKEVLEAFQKWCLAAENSGVGVLTSFVTHLRSYRFTMTG